MSLRENPSLHDLLIDSLEIQIAKLIEERDRLRKRNKQLEDAVRSAAALLEQSAAPFDTGCQILRGILPP